MKVEILKKTAWIKDAKDEKCSSVLEGVDNLGRPCAFKCHLSAYHGNGSRKGGKNHKSFIGSGYVRWPGRGTSGSLLEVARKEFEK